MTASLNRISEENWEMFLASNPDPDLEFTFISRRSNELSGEEHAQVQDYYLSDDEYAEACALDLLAKQLWLEGAALDGEYEDFFPEQEWYDEDEEEVVEASWAEYLDDSDGY